MCHSIDEIQNLSGFHATIETTIDIYDNAYIKHHDTKTNCIVFEQGGERFICNRDNVEIHLCCKKCQREYEPHAINDIFSKWCISCANEIQDRMNERNEEF